MTFPLPSELNDVCFCSYVGLSLRLFLRMSSNKKSFKKKSYSKNHLTREYVYQMILRK